MITVILCEDNNGVGPEAVAVTILSVIESNKDSQITIILHSDFAVDIQGKITSIAAGSQNIRIQHWPLLHCLAPNYFDSSKEEYRFLLDRTLLHRLLLPQIHYALERYIFIDADVIVDRPLAELWNIDLDDKLVAGVRDGIEDLKFTELGLQPPYLNAGVLLYNASLWRNANATEAAYNYLLSHKETTFDVSDQDAINYVSQGKKVVVDLSWNVMHKNASRLPPAGSRILHFAGPVKPWHSYADFDFQILFRSILSRTSFVTFTGDHLPDNFTKTISIAHQLYRRGNLVTSASWYKYALTFLTAPNSLNQLLVSHISYVEAGVGIKDLLTLNRRLVLLWVDFGLDILFESPYQLRGLLSRP